MGCTDLVQPIKLFERVLVYIKTQDNDVIQLILSQHLDYVRSNEYNVISITNLSGACFMNGYLTVQEIALKWGISPRQVQILCKNNRIPGAVRMSRIWIIPEDASKPTASKTKED